MLEKLIGESKALERAIAGEELNMQDGLELMKYDNIYTIGAVADAIRKKFVGDKVTFTSSSYLNYTNVLLMQFGKNLLVIKLHSLRHHILITLMSVLPVVRYAHFTEKKMMMMHIHCHQNK